MSRPSDAGVPETDFSERRLLDLAYDNLAPYLRRFATAAPSSSSIELGGVVGCIMPSCPRRSLLNCVTYDRSRPDELVGNLDRLRSMYADAGVGAWGIWMLDGEVELARELTAAGLKLDSTPAAMTAPMTELRLGSGRADVEISDDWDPAAMARLNAIAYGLPDDEFAALGGLAAEDDMFMFSAIVEGERVACNLVQHLPGGDCSVYFVATAPAHRSQGLGRAVMEASLHHACDAGCVTTSLQASDKGFPMYLKLGYRDLGRKVELWEHRAGEGQA
ncbi:MAG: GNAT family N-acetyltransferase [Solirubrobacterales bacterium]